MINKSIKPIITAELERILEQSKHLGLKRVEITAGTLQRICKLDQRTPAVCNVMRKRLRLELGDVETRRDSVKPDGDSTTNTFSYFLET